MPSQVLIVDDEPNILSSFSSLLRDEGHDSSTASSAEEALRKCSAQTFDLVLLDLQLPGLSGIEFLRQIGKTPPAPKVLVISGHADIASALEAVRLGAVDFLEKPVPPEKFIASVGSALSLVAAEKQRNMMVDEIDSKCRIIGRSRSIENLLSNVQKVAPSDTTVLITGENGTGKELIATRLYLESKRRDRPYIKVNCPGIPETLFESELFGHVKGSFTGAVRNHPGKFVQADTGTIFLDEIGDLPLPCQAKLLRVLETGEVETLGRETPQHVDIRVVCATNSDLGRLISEGKFREDLYYRISVFNLEVPPLSERTDDIPLLAGEFLRRFDPTGQTQLSATAMASLCSFRFPGNVRQLRNLIERLTILYPGNTIEETELLSRVESDKTAVNHNGVDLSLTDQVSQYEKRLIESTLQKCQGNISQTARRLKTDRANLSRKIKEFGLKSTDR